MSAPPTANPSWTVLALLRWTTDHFAQKGIESARLDAECLLAHALGTSRMQLYVDFEKPVSEEARGRFRELVRRRASERIPVSQLLGEKEFWSLTFRVTSDVLTPRPDTETLVQAALDRLPDPQAPWEILDVGTGSGAIALALARERPKAHVLATDISEAALKVAAENAERLQLSERVRFARGSLFEPVDALRAEGGGSERFALVVSNPPYLAQGQAGSLAPELRHEPAVALFGGEDGLEVLRPLCAGAREVLEPGGWLLVEIDPEQAEAVETLCRDAGLGGFERIRDLAGRNRVIAARMQQREEP